MRFHRVIATVVPSVWFMLAVGCSGGDDDSAEDGGNDSATEATGEDSTRESFVVAFAESIDNPYATADDSRCMGEATVDVVGVETLEAAGTPDELREAGGQLPAFGVEVDEAMAGELFDALNTCVDQRTLVFGDDEALPPDVRTCLDSRVPDEVFRAYMTSTYLSPDGQGDPQLLAQVSTGFEECSGAGGASG